MKANHRLAAGRVRSVTLGVSRTFAPEPEVSVTLARTYSLDRVTLTVGAKAQAAKDDRMIRRDSAPSTIALR